MSHGVKSVNVLYFSDQQNSTKSKLGTAEKGSAYKGAKSIKNVLIFHDINR